MGAFLQGCHHKGIGIAVPVGREIEERVKPCERDTHEIYEVVSCESHCKREGSHQDNRLENVDLEKGQYRYQGGHRRKADGQEHTGVLTDELLDIRRHKDRALESVDKQEPNDGRGADSAEQDGFQGSVPGFDEGEYKPGYPHHQHARNEGYGDGQEDGGDYAQGLVRIQKLSQAGAVFPDHLYQ